MVSKEGNNQVTKAGVKLASCFIISPISDAEGYLPGHFSRVYGHLIRPACSNAGYEAIRSDDVRRTNYIAIDVLRQIITSDLVLCDLSSKNPNVMYELGIRQAFNKPVVLIKDRKTERVFDIQGLRFFEYDESLRVDLVQNDISAISEALIATAKAPKTDVNSLVELLGVKAAELPQPIELSERDSLILNTLKEIGDRIDSLSTQRPQYYTTYATAEFQSALGGHTTEYGKGTYPFYQTYVPTSQKRRVKELWDEAKFEDLIGKSLLDSGVNIGIIVSVDPRRGQLTFIDANSREKSVTTADERFKGLAIYEEVSI